MFKFTTTTGETTVPVELDGVKYDLPRFTLPDVEIWGDLLENAKMEAALAEYKDEEKRAKIRQYWMSVPVDVAELDERSRTPAGIKYILEYCMAKAKVPDDVIDRVIVQVRWSILQELAKQLLSMANGVQVLTAMTGGEDKKSPLTERKPDSGAKRSRGKTGRRASKASTTAKSAS
jgi:hypothetical protein